jgi:hypothetical protein
MTLKLAPLSLFRSRSRRRASSARRPATTDGLAKLLAVVSKESGFEANTFGWQRLAVAPSRCHDHFECASGFGNRRRALIGMTYLGMRHGPKEVMSIRGPLIRFHITFGKLSRELPRTCSYVSPRAPSLCSNLVQESCPDTGGHAIGCIGHRREQRDVQLS